MPANDFYVYVLFRPDGRPCYVGKGIGDRWLWHEKNRKAHPNLHLRRIMTNAGAPLPKIIVRADLSEADAKATEIALIGAIGRDINSGPLVNMTDGGDGQVGWNPSVATRERIRISNTGKTASAETKKLMSSVHSGRPKSASHRAAIGVANIGRVVSAETRQKMRDASARRWARAEERDKLRLYHAAMTDQERIERGSRISDGMRLAGQTDV